MKVIEITHCSKHRFPSYHCEDGSVKHTCSACYPELIVKPDKRKSIVNYGSAYLNNEDVHSVVKTGHIEYTVPDHASDEFFNKAHDEGVELEYGDNVINGLKIKVYRSGAKSTLDKFWFSSNVYFNPEVVNIPPEYTVHYNGNRAYVSSNDFAAYVLSTVLKGE